MLPTADPVTRPSGATLARVVSAEVQLAVCVRSSVLRSEKTPVAVRCTEVPLAMEGPGGVTAIEVRTAEVTVTVVAPDTPAWVAVIVAVPTPVPVTRPVGSTVARVASVEVQLADCVRSSVLRSEKTPVAVSCSEKPLAMEGPVGVTKIEVKTGGVTVTVVEPDTPA